MIRRTLALYTIVEELGEGGMGEVYRARDTKLDQYESRLPLDHPIEVVGFGEVSSTNLCNRYLTLSGHQCTRHSRS